MPDYYEQFAPRCAGCKKPILPENVGGFFYLFYFYKKIIISRILARQYVSFPTTRTTTPIVIFAKLEIEIFYFKKIGNFQQGIKNSKNIPELRNFSGRRDARLLPSAGPPSLSKLPPEMGLFRLAPPTHH